MTIDESPKPDSAAGAEKPPRRTATYVRRSIPVIAWVVLLFRDTPTALFLAAAAAGIYIAYRVLRLIGRALFRRRSIESGAQIGTIIQQGHRD